MALRYKPTEAIIKPHILKVASNLFIYARPESFKTWLAIDMAFALTTGTQWLENFDVKMTKTLIIQAEQDDAEFRERFTARIEHMNGSVPMDEMYIETEIGLKLDNSYYQGQVEKWVVDSGAKVVIFDNLFMMTSASSSEEVGLKKVFDFLNRLRREYRVATILIHHPRKASSERNDDLSFDEMVGSFIIGAWAETIIKITMTDKERDIMSVELEKQKNAIKRIAPFSLRFNRVTTHFEYN